MKTSVIAVDPEILSGAPCSAGTRVPVQALFAYLNGGHPLADFLAEFPTVSEGQVRQVLAEARERLLGTSKNGPETAA